MPSRKKMMSYIKNGCSRKIWTVVNNRLGRDSILWKPMSYTEAWSCMLFAQNDVQIAGENRKDFTQYNVGNGDSKKDKKPKKDKKDRKPRGDNDDATLAGAQAEKVSAANVSSESAANRFAETLWNGTPMSE